MSSAPLPPGVPSRPLPGRRPPDLDPVFGGRPQDCPHGQVQVPYLVPVEVVVNRPAVGIGLVRRVVVIDEGAQLDTASEFRCYDCGDVLPADADAVRDAVRIAQNPPPGTGWPAWGVGW